MASADELIAVGRVGAPHGLRGDVAVVPWTDDAKARFAIGTVLRTDRPDVTSLTVSALRSQGDRLLIRFCEVTDRDAASALRGTQLLTRAGDRPPLDDPEEFYDSDLIGLAAVTTDERDLGPVRDVVHAPGGDYLVVEVDGRERLIPFVAAIVPVIDLPNGRVRIDPPEGLLDL